ncbi:AraC family transcriptional regulator [Phenylobacterium sp.]|uniref:AraC family transcriptional regulator n=1 Tax=Phenylobacterium sp. TaxID=1871053 RepID=UPI00122268AC|nr:AraC family transcriptional regulator [Phenylobacterium sp.]THD61020.1 MAG: AraC family transcriptional regulator [Phenylobacterium sp.]
MSQLGRSAGLTGFVDVARSLGLDPYRLAAEAGVPRAALSDPDMLVASAAMSQLIEMAAERSGAEDFGLRMATERSLSTMGVIGLALRNQPTTRKALEMLSEYAWLQNEALSIRLEEQGEEAMVIFGLIGWRGRQASELLMAIAFRLLRTLRGPGWKPLEIRFLHAAPRNIEAQRKLFGVTPLYEQDIFGLVFERADLDKPNVVGDPGMAPHLTRYLEHLADGRSQSLRSRVMDQVLLLLPSGTATVERVAESMRIERRTLHRRLAAEGTSFSQILENARGELATSLLASSERPLQNVAEMLGFSSLSAFGHWFRRRFNTTASQYRALGGQMARPQASRTPALAN